jgi:2-hydroxy-3-keto-5-methylthiopentenyl-1-phosphate phosphatase
MQRAETVVQCDFDDTVTVGDVSYLLLDAFASGDWTPALDEYRERRITVSEFNARVFSLVTAGERAMLDHLDGRVTVRDGLGDLVDACRRLDFRLVIVSNGLKFYIDRILARLGISGIEVQAAQTCFLPEGLQVAYVAPDGARPEAGLKDYHVGSCAAGRRWTASPSRISMTSSRCWRRSGTRHEDRPAHLLRGLRRRGRRAAHLRGPRGDRLLLQSEHTPRGGVPATA